MPESVDPTPANLATLRPDVRTRAHWLVYLLRYYGFPAVITEARRSAARQRELYAQGRTAPGPIVTGTLESRHIQGRAFDIDAYRTDPDRVPVAWWQFGGAIGEALGLIWGGRWRLRDYRHFEL